MVMACISPSGPGCFFLKSGKVASGASLALPQEATVSPPPAEPPPPQPASVPLPRSAAPASPAPPILKNRRRLMPPLTHLTFLPLDKPHPSRSTARAAPVPVACRHSYRGAAGLMCSELRRPLLPEYCCAPRPALFPPWSCRLTRTAPGRIVRTRVTSWVVSVRIGRAGFGDFAACRMAEQKGRLWPGVSAAGRGWDHIGQPPRRGG